MSQSFAPECFTNNDTSLLLYCNADTCPTVYNPEQNPPICDNFSKCDSHRISFKGGGICKPELVFVCGQSFVCTIYWIIQ